MPYVVDSAGNVVIDSGSIIVAFSAYSANSLENYCEQFAVALLEQNTDLQTLLTDAVVTRQNEDSAANKNRIVCKASPREIEMTGKNPSTVLIWRVPVDVEITYTDRSAANFDSLCALVHVAMNAAPGATAESIRTTASIRAMDDTDDGETVTDGNTRTRTKRFVFLSEWSGNG